MKFNWKKYVWKGFLLSVGIGFLSLFYRLITSIDMLNPTSVGLELISLALAIALAPIYYLIVGYMAEYLLKGD